MKARIRRRLTVTQGSALYGNAPEARKQLRGFPPLRPLCRSLVTCLLLSFFLPSFVRAQSQPDQLRFVRQAVKRMVFDESQAILLARLDPATLVGMPVMHPVQHFLPEKASLSIDKAKLVVSSEPTTETTIWLGGFNPFATYSIDLEACSGEGEIGFEFSDADKKEQFLVTAAFTNNVLTDVRLRVIKGATVIADQSIAVNRSPSRQIRGRLILQLLGSGLTLYVKDEALPEVVGQSDFSGHLDLRVKDRMRSFQSQLFLRLQRGQVVLSGADMALTTGIGLADIRAITYENGDLFFDRERLWYTMSIRGRALPHHLQGVFSMNPTVFDLKLEGIILFDRNDGLLRNEIASHIYYDRKEAVWRGLTTGFSAYANPGQEKKQLLAVESKKDPRFGFSVMRAEPFGMVGDIEDPHILFDSTAKKWRILTCENRNGYKAVLLESDVWNKGYKKIAGPVPYNSTGTSIQKINGRYYCFSGSAEGRILIYTYPDMKPAGHLKMDRPPWNDSSGTRVWPNVVQLPEGYPFRFVALMMDRFNYPGLQGPNWSYGALYLYHAD